MFGVPLVAVAALVSIARGRPEEDEEAEETDPMAPPETSGPTSGTIAGGTRDTGAIGTGSLSSFLNGVTEYLDNLEDRNTEAIAELRSTNDQWRQDLADQIASLDRDSDTPNSPGATPAPTPPPPGGTPYLDQLAAEGFVSFEEYMAHAPPENAAADGTISQAFLDYHMRALAKSTIVEGPQGSQTYVKVG